MRLAYQLEQGALIQLEQSPNSGQKTARAQFFSIGSLIRNGHGVYGSMFLIPCAWAYDIYGSANIILVIKKVYIVHVVDTGRKRTLAYKGRYRDSNSYN